MTTQYEVETTLDSEVISKFEEVLNNESMLYGGSAAHQSNNVNIPEIPEVPEAK